MYTIPHTSLPTVQRTYSFSSSLFYPVPDAAVPANATYRYLRVPVYHSIPLF